MFADSVTPKGFFNTIYVVITGLFDLIVDGILAIALALIIFNR
jgi:ABC-type transport system involved in multi-copper enzyme maturation permease subunit